MNSSEMIESNCVGAKAEGGPQEEDQEPNG